MLPPIRRETPMIKNNFQTSKVVAVVMVCAVLGISIASGQEAAKKPAPKA